jgi:hypothetical protein
MHKHGKGFEFSGQLQMCTCVSIFINFKFYVQCIKFYITKIYTFYTFICGVSTDP